MALDGNYDLAYIGIGRSLLRQKQYKEAMDYFELKYDEDNYSRAYKQYRKEWVEAVHIAVAAKAEYYLTLIVISEEAPAVLIQAHIDIIVKNRHILRHRNSGCV